MPRLFEPDRSDKSRSSFPLFVSIPCLSFLHSSIWVMITHQNLDHIGSLPVLLAEGPPSVEVWAHELSSCYSISRLAESIHR